MKAKRSPAFITLLATGCLSLFCALLLLVPQARADVIISDDFTAADGTALGGRTTPVGGVQWTDHTTAGGTPVIESNGVTFNNPAVASDGYFSVPFSVGSLSSFEIDVNMWPHGNNMNLTFATTSTATQYSAQMLFWGAVNSVGQWGLYQSATLLGSGGGLTAGSTSYGDASLAYDVPTSTLTFKVNNVVLYSGVQVVDLSSITTAGISYATMTDEPAIPEVTSFAIVGVPEPSSVALCMAGMGVGAMMLRRRIRK